jgi:delta 1-pyrroline-5-carboxylate dehydrogenase
VVLASEDKPLCAITFAEVLHSSDVPSGVVNILTGSTHELTETLASHMDVNAIVYGGEDQTILKIIKENAVANIKRVAVQQKDWMKTDSQDLYMLSDTQELKTTWHPIENIGGASSSY